MDIVIGVALVILFIAVVFIVCVAWFVSEYAEAEANDSEEDLRCRQHGRF